MKNLINVCLLFFIVISAHGQVSGTIHYNIIEKLEMSFEGMPKGVDISGMLPSERIEDKVLVFTATESIYYDGAKEEEETEMKSDDGSFTMVFIESDIENKLYTNLQTRESLNQQGFMEKPFIIASKSDKLKWKITSEKVKYLDYECIKATTQIKENDKVKEIIAWFAPAVKSTSGPKEFGQLPGAILMLSIDGDKTKIKATKVDLNKDVEINKPTDGELVTEEEFNKIVDEKLKEMAKEYGGSGNSVISIRG